MTIVPRSGSSTAGQRMVISTSVLRGLTLPSSRVAMVHAPAGTSVMFPSISMNEMRGGVGVDVGATPWWIMLAGAGAITLRAAAFYLIGVGLREALDPRTGRMLG